MVELGIQVTDVQNIKLRFVSLVKVSHKRVDEMKLCVISDYSMLEKNVFPSRPFYKNRARWINRTKVFTEDKNQDCIIT
jgi:hypothetical protein